MEASIKARDVVNLHSAFQCIPLNIRLVVMVDLQTWMFAMAPILLTLKIEQGKQNREFFRNEIKQLQQQSLVTAPMQRQSRDETKIVVQEK